MSARVVHIGAMGGLDGEAQAYAMILAAHGAVERALRRREALAVSPGVYWPTVTVAISLDELAALLAAVPAHRWPERCRPLRRELQEAVRIGEATRP